MSLRSGASRFAEQENHEIQAVWTYKVMTMATWLGTVLVSVYYTFGMPDRVREQGGKTIWDLNQTYHTLFAFDAVIIAIYWAFVFMLQIVYMWHLFSVHNEHVQAAAGVGTHFILNNILQSGFIILFIHEYFFWAELVLVINFFNLLVLYLNHNTYPRLIHMPVTTGPMAWNFFALYWNGAILVGSHTMLVQILAVISVWGILGYGWFFLFLFKDYTITFALSILCSSLGVEQYLVNTVLWQWISAFVIMALLFISTLLVGVPSMFGKEIAFRREQYIVSEDFHQDLGGESAPLLEDA